MAFVSNSTAVICLPDCGRRPTAPIGCNCLKKSKAMFAREIEHFLGMAPNLMRRIGK